jgi:hypothetical protein
MVRTPTPTGFIAEDDAQKTSLLVLSLLPPDRPAKLQQLWPSRIRTSHTARTQPHAMVRAAH